MKSTQRLAALALALPIFVLIGCTGGGSASNDQMAAARDAQVKAMGEQRKNMSPNSNAQQSADAAGRAKPAGGATGQ